MKPSGGQRYESLVQAAERTGLSVATLRRRIADGQLPALRNGRRIIRVRPKDVDRLLRPSQTAYGWWHSSQVKRFGTA
ncbi:MAG: helix-turn-helix domain-containing protein [Propionibacteriaceae bacterium]|nr:helix-turn-helix domain-containing protein [Propionibacteriaceae bacterium]